LTNFKAVAKTYKEGDSSKADYEEAVSVLKGLKRNHVKWLQVERVYKAIKSERKKQKPNYDRIKELEGTMTKFSKQLLKK